MKRLVRVDDIQVKSFPHKHFTNVRPPSPTSPIETSSEYTYVMIPYYEELTWRQRRKRKQKKTNGNGVALKL